MEGQEEANTNEGQTFDSRDKLTKVNVSMFALNWTRSRHKYGANGIDWERE